MAIIIEEREEINEINELFKEYLSVSFKITDENKIEEIFSNLQEKTKEKKRIVFVASQDKKPIGFLVGKNEGEIFEISGFYIQDGFNSENCGYQLISTLASKVFEMGFKHYRQTITLPANFESSLESSLKNDGFRVYPRVEMMRDLQKDETIPISLPEGYVFEPFSIEMVDELFLLMKDANPKEHTDSHIYPEMLEPEKSKEIFSRLSNEFTDLDIDINPQIFFENKLIGLSFVIAHNSEIAFIAEISISPNHQRKGLGQALTKKISSECTKKGYKKLGLAVTVENTGAYKLYKKLEFKTTTKYLAIAKHNQ